MSSSRACKNSEFGRASYRGPILVICGPTGSGKTAVAIELAKRLGEVIRERGVVDGYLGGAEADVCDNIRDEGEIFGEVISADSRAIYKYMDIGTAKPTVLEREGVKHFGFDLVEPGERFTVADWKEYAERCIAEIRSRGHIPIVAGGTGLYIDALVFDYQFGGQDEEIEQKNCSDKTGVDADFAKKYPDRVKMREDVLIYGIKWEAQELRQRLLVREQKMYSDELFEETRFLVNKYGWGSQAMKSNIYQFAWKYLSGECSKGEAIEQNFYDDWHLVKRQMTWFRRNAEIKWVRADEIVEQIMNDFIKSYT